jgi:hypothetical protein
MFGSSVLEVAIGLVFTYLLLSLMCSVINEWIARITALRSVTLWAAIKHLLNDPKAESLAKALYEHPLISLGEPHSQPTVVGWMYRWFGEPHLPHKPAYIAPRTFALALLNVAAPAAADGSRTLKPDLDTELHRLLEGLKADAADVQGWIRNVEVWYDNAMERVSGWYKRSTQTITLVLGLILAGILNADTLMYAQYLWSNTAVRQALAQDASGWLKAHEGGTTKQAGDLSKLQKELEKTGLPLGWSLDRDPQSQDIRKRPEGLAWLWKALGLILTGLAISLGAPFWFDALKSLGSLRSTGKPPARVTV